jgi:thiamine pyrophosphate-dependent acetolactate synthase large subunit-like protein
MSDIKNGKQTSAQLLIRSLVQQNVKHIFGIPGGKIMPTFDVLHDEGPQLIVCRHEQNPAFMAAAIGRLTGRPGVCLVISGPGTGNLVAGAAAATTEGDSTVAIGGVVLPDTLKQTHESMGSVAVMKPVTQFSAAIDAPDAAGEPVANGFRAAMAPRPGACSIAFPGDVQSAATEAGVPPSLPLLPLGAAPPADMIRKDADKISKAASSADCSRTLAVAISRSAFYRGPEAESIVLDIRSMSRTYGIRHVRLDATSNSFHTQKAFRALTNNSKEIKLCRVYPPQQKTQCQTKTYCKTQQSRRRP